MSIRDRVKELLKENGMSISALESTLGFGNGTIAKWEKTAPSAVKLQKVADYLDVSVDYLLGRTERKNPYDESAISGSYLSLAKEAEESGIDPEDIRLMMETIKRLQKEN